MWLAACLVTEQWKKITPREISEIKYIEIWTNFWRKKYLCEDDKAAELKHFIENGVQNIEL